MPDYRKDNPYQELIARSYREQGMEVVFPKGYKRVFPLFRELKKNRADKLNLHWPDQYFKGDSAFVKVIYGIKLLLDLLFISLSGHDILWTVHNIVSHNSKHRGIELFFYRLYVRLAKEIIVHSDSVCAKVSVCYNCHKKKIKVIEHPSYKSFYPEPWPSKEEARLKLGIDVESIVYLNLGQVSPYKGIKEVLLQWSGFHAMDSRRYFLIAGKANDEIFASELEDILKVNSGVRWDKGFVDDVLIPYYFQAADYVLLPYKQITTSGSEVLAKDFNKPIIRSLYDK